jgi:hypothetical protein
MVYIPSPYGAGKFILANKRTGEKENTKTLSATGMSMSDGSRRIIQPGGVVMRAPGFGALREEGSAPPTICAQYPAKLLRGYICKEMPPQWLINKEGMPVLGSEIDKSTTKVGKADLSLEGFIARKGSTDTLRKELNDLSMGVMTEMCKYIYEDIRLAGSTATITTNLDLNMKLGTRTLFKNPGGGEFTGFVSAITHRIDLREGKQLNSATSFSLTHIQY